jgi:uncharacterized protein (TIGR03790 family)
MEMLGFRCALGVALAAIPLIAQKPENVLVVVNDHSSISREIGEYYARRRSIPLKNVCRIRTSTEETIPRLQYNAEIAAPIETCLQHAGAVESVLYIVTTMGVPLRIAKISGDAMTSDEAAVDSELTLLYADLHNGRPHAIAGSLPNPFFGQSEAKFAHPAFPIYLVTRLAAYDFEGVKGIIERALIATNRGKFVIDMRGSGDAAGEEALKRAAILLPKERTILDETSKVLYDQIDVIGYAGWGSNDPNRHRRFLGFHWLPGAIMTEYVSTNGRTFAAPPASWNISNWSSPNLWFAGSPQTMTADYVREGVTGASGHVNEPYLVMTPQPQFLLPTYYHGRNLAESYYLSIRGLSWQNIVIGDPLCSIGPPK